VFEVGRAIGTGWLQQDARSLITRTMIYGRHDPRSARRRRTERHQHQNQHHRVKALHELNLLFPRCWRTWNTSQLRDLPQKIARPGKQFSLCEQKLFFIAFKLMEKAKQNIRKNY
jgi:hypothetical protein